MNPAAFLAAVRRTMRRRGMEGDGPVLVACSGGPDSLALLHALPPLGLEVVVAHFDHRMRPGSEADAAFVRAEAEKLRVAFVGGEREGAAPKGASPEEALRDARLAFLERAAAEAGCGRIATGHTLDDQAETVLMRVVAGTGRRGLGGIPPVRPFAGGVYVRPLIDLRRADVETFCAALDLTPRRDPTNADPRFRRNSVRAELIPVLEGRFNARVAEALARLADVTRDEDAWLDEQAALALEIGSDKSVVRIPATELAKLPPALSRRVLRSVVPRASHEEIERLRVLALEGDTGDEVDLGATLNGRLEYGFLLVGPAHGRRPSAAPVEILLPGNTDAWGWRVRTWLTDTHPDPFPDGRSVCALDAALVRPPLTWRAPRTGDRFRPLGMTRSKKLGDFFTDSKVPLARRAATPLLCDAGDEIVWVVGHRPADPCKVTGSTERVLWLEAEPPAAGGGIDD